MSSKTVVVAVIVGLGARPEKWKYFSRYNRARERAFTLPSRRASLQTARRL